MALLSTVSRYALPIVLSAALAEALVLSWRHRRHGGAPYDWKAAGLSLFDFLVRQYPLHWLLPLTFWTGAMDWVWQHRLWTLPMDRWHAWVACFLVQEFCYYVYHRTAHRMRWFWCSHSVHHSPNQLNLSAAYRLGWTGRLTGSLAFFLLAPWLGLPPAAVLGLLSLNLLYQFWIHTTWIPRLGPLEWVLNTPSAHRVHHASNLEYLDGNYGGVLIVFDRLFGTYIPERRELPCRYGLVQPAPDHDLLRIEFGPWQALWRDLRAAPSWRAACGLLLRPPGWRPDGPGETTEELRARAAAQGAGADAAAAPAPPPLRPRPADRSGPPPYDLHTPHPHSGGRSS